MTEPPPFKPDFERKQLADGAKELLDNKAFTAAILALRKQWFAELMTQPFPDKIMELTHKMQALEAIPQQLQILVNDEKMHQARMK